MESCCATHSCADYLSVAADASANGRSPESSAVSTPAGKMTTPQQSPATTATNYITVTWPPLPGTPRNVETSASGRFLLRYQDLDQADGASSGGWVEVPVARVADAATIPQPGIRAFPANNRSCQLRFHKLIVFKVIIVSQFYMKI